MGGPQIPRNGMPRKYIYLYLKSIFFLGRAFVSFATEPRTKMKLKIITLETTMMLTVGQR